MPDEPSIPQIPVRDKDWQTKPMNGEQAQELIRISTRIERYAAANCLANESTLKILKSIDEKLGKMSQKKG